MATDTLARRSASASFGVTVIAVPYANPSTPGDSVADGGCTVTRASSSSNYGSLGLLGLALVAVRRIRRRSSAT